MKKEEKSLEEKLTRKKKQENLTEYLPTTKQRSAASQDGKIAEMRREQGNIRKDAMRTPASLRKKIRKSVRPTATSSSPSLKQVKVASIRKLFELGVADRDVLHTTSPLTDRSVYKSKINPFKCADQWCVARQTGPRQDAESSERQGCDWTDDSLVGEMHQSDGASQHQDGSG